MFGGKEILEESSTMELGPKVWPVVFMSLIIQILLILVKITNKITHPQKPLDDYIKTIKISVVENSTNVFTLTTIAATITLLVLYLQYLLSVLDEIDEEAEIYQLIHEFFCISLIIVLLPYVRSFPLR